MRILCGAILAAAAGAATILEARQTTPLNDGWTANGEAVSLPHCWNVDDGSDGPSYPDQWRHDSVVANGLSGKAKFVKSVTFNGKPVTNWQLLCADIMSGGRLVFEMGE